MYNILIENNDKWVSLDISGDIPLSTSLFDRKNPITDYVPFTYSFDIVKNSKNFKLLRNKIKIGESNLLRCYLTNGVNVIPGYIEPISETSNAWSCSFKSLQSTIKDILSKIEIPNLDFSIYGNYVIPATYIDLLRNQGAIGDFLIYPAVGKIGTSQYADISYEEDGFLKNAFPLLNFSDLVTRIFAVSGLSISLEKKQSLYIAPKHLVFLDYFNIIPKGSYSFPIQRSNLEFRLGARSFGGKFFSFYTASNTVYNNVLYADSIAIDDIKCRNLAIKIKVQKQLLDGEYIWNIANKSDSGYDYPWFAFAVGGKQGKRNIAHLFESIEIDDKLMDVIFSSFQDNPPPALMASIYGDYPNQGLFQINGYFSKVFEAIESSEEQSLDILFCLDGSSLIYNPTAFKWDYIHNSSFSKEYLDSTFNEISFISNRKATRIPSSITSVEIVEIKHNTSSGGKSISICKSLGFSTALDLLEAYCNYTNSSLLCEDFSSIKLVSKKINEDFLDVSNFNYTIDKITNVNDENSWGILGVTDSRMYQIAGEEYSPIHIYEPTEVNLKLCNIADGFQIVPYEDVNEDGNLIYPRILDAPTIVDIIRNPSTGLITINPTQHTNDLSRYYNTWDLSQSKIKIEATALNNNTGTDILNKKIFVKELGCIAVITNVLYQDKLLKIEAYVI